MDREAFAEMDCPIARSLAVIGEWWTPLILRDIYAGLTRFDAIHANLGVSRKVLSQRLATLTEHGVIERVPYQDNPPRYDYRLTTKGLELGAVLLAMKSWGDRWTAGAGDGAPGTWLRHERCGSITEPILTCSSCGEPLAPQEVTLLPAEEAEQAAAPR
jgi:DNA-binding HxlR family transcriptional regulator